MSICETGKATSEEIDVARPAHRLLLRPLRRGERHVACAAPVSSIRITSLLTYCKKLHYLAIGNTEEFLAVLYFFLLAGCVVMAMAAPWIFFVIPKLIPTLLCSCNVILLLITCIFRQYLVYQVRKVRLQGYYSFSQKLKHIARLPFDTISYGTALMLIIIVWYPYVHILSVSTLLRIVMFVEVICVRCFMSIYIVCLHQYNSLNGQPDFLKSLYSALLHGGCLLSYVCSSTGINALFSHGPRRSTCLARVYALWNITSLINVATAFICELVYYTYASNRKHQILHPWSLSTDKSGWWLFLLGLVLCKCIHATLVNWHVANLEIQDRSLYSKDPNILWQSEGVMSKLWR